MVIALLVSSIRHCACTHIGTIARRHSYVWHNRDLQMCSGTLVWTPERERERELPLSPLLLFYEHFKVHIRTLTLASEGVITDTLCARPIGRRCSFDIDMHYISLDVYNPRGLEYFLLQKREPRGRGTCTPPIAG